MLHLQDVYKILNMNFDCLSFIIQQFTKFDNLILLIILNPIQWVYLCRLTISKKWSKLFPQIPEGHHLIDFTAFDSEGHPWPFCLSTRTEAKYAKPVLNEKGWLPFVRAKSLKIGDEITFSREANEANEVILRIRARKSIMRLFGQNIYEDEAV